MQNGAEKAVSNSESPDLKPQWLNLTLAIEATRWGTVQGLHSAADGRQLQQLWAVTAAVKRYGDRALAIGTATRTRTRWRRKTQAQKRKRSPQMFRFQTQTRLPFGVCRKMPAVPQRTCRRRCSWAMQVASNSNSNGQQQQQPPGLHNGGG